jgi:hypothetical protein
MATCPPFFPQACPDAAAGLDGTLLYVDTNNPTPALGLYQSVGMRSDQVVELWETQLPTNQT